jgi:hypothetical protein
LALLCLALGFVALVTVNPPASTTPIFNERFGTYLFAIAVFALWRGWVAQGAKAGGGAGNWRLAARSRRGGAYGECAHPAGGGLGDSQLLVGAALGAATGT